MLYLEGYDMLPEMPVFEESLRHGNTGNMQQLMNGMQGQQAAQPR